MIALVVWQQLLDGLGWVLAWIYDIVPNYGLAIVILTIAIRALLLPLGFKQIKSMQNMQALQPKIKEIQKKYKNNRQKQQEEQMKLYRESGVSPFSGCLPMLLTFPFLIAMYAVIKQPAIVPAANQPANAQVFMVANNHLPEDSALFQNVLTHQDTDFLFMNLQCNLVGAGTQVEIKYKNSDGQVVQLPAGDPILGENGQPLTFDAKTQSFLDCGSKRFPDIIPYILIVVVMVGLTFFQTFQMQRASPPQAQSSQQQAITRVMPLMFAFFGLSFPAGLVVYWTVSNALQIAQQTYLLKKGHIGPEALERQIERQKARASDPSPKKGIMGWMSERAEAAQQQRSDLQKQRGPKGKGTGQQPKGKRSGGQASKGSPRPKKPTGPGGSSAAKNPGEPRRRKGPPPGNQLRPNPAPEQPEDEA